ncbi:UNVERIFIED_ORG: hypothetical protein GGD59_000485 [Rhizobium esperanzae]
MAIPYATAEDAWLLGKVYRSGIDIPETGSHAKHQGTEEELVAKGRLKELLAEKGLRVLFSGPLEKTLGRRCFRRAFPKRRNYWRD